MKDINKHELQEPPPKDKHSVYPFGFVSSDFTVMEVVEIATIIVAWYATSSLTNNLNKSILDDSVSYKESTDRDNLEDISVSIDAHIITVCLCGAVLLYDVSNMAKEFQNAENWIWLHDNSDAAVRVTNRSTFIDSVESAARASIIYTYSKGMGVFNVNLTRMFRDARRYLLSFFQSITTLMSGILGRCLDLLWLLLQEWYCHP
jgi:hypothetical protein